MGEKGQSKLEDHGSNKRNAISSFQKKYVLIFFFFLYFLLLLFGIYGDYVGLQIKQKIHGKIGTTSALQQASIR